MMTQANQSGPIYLSLDVLSKTQAITVAVFHVEVATTVLLVTNVPHNLHTLRLELRVECVSILYPNVCVPSSSLRIHGAIGTHDTSLVELGQHDHNSIALDHTERWRLLPETFVTETKLVSIVVSGGDNVVDDKIRSDVPARTVSRNTIS